VAARLQALQSEGHIEEAGAQHRNAEELFAQLGIKHDAESRS
jgi:hypothetical protein